MPLSWARRNARGPVWRVPRPERLLFAPQDLRTSDPTVAADIYGGLYTFAGETVETGGHSPFALAAPSPGWERALYGFDWLRHLRAADTAIARENARALVGEAVGKRRRDLRRGIAREPRVVARRVISFLCQSPLVLNGADRVFYAQFLRAVGRGVASLERDVVSARRPVDRLAAAIALSYAALCCSGFENRLRRATRLMSAELEAQILPDGGHVSRHPGILVEFLLDLLPLRLLYASRNLETPEALARAVDRMAPMLRYLRAGGRELALFNGMGATAFDQVATLLSYDNVRGAPPAYAAESGYLRLRAGETVLIADTGGAPPTDSSAAACAGCLSFELWSEGRRLVVNAGTPCGIRRSRDASRRTPAHSTLGLGDASSAEFLDDAAGAAADWLRRRLGPVVLAGPGTVVAERGTDPDGAQTCAARHDGYAARFGVVHERRWALSPDGQRLIGEDRLAGEATGTAGPATLRFHLHPGAVVTLDADGSAVLLDRPGLPRWRFEAGPARPTLEDSVFYGGPEGWRPTVQIVVRSEGPDLAPIRWSFSREATPSGPG